MRKRRVPIRVTLYIRLEDEQKNCAIWGVYLLRITLNICLDFTTAEQPATQIVANNLAACVNILPNLTSLYQWQGHTRTFVTY